MRSATGSAAGMCAAVTALLLACAAAGCGSDPRPAQRDGGRDALSDSSYWYDTAPQDGPRERPDVAPIPGLTVTVDGVPWYVLNGSTSWSPALSRSYISAMVSCDACTDVSQFLISLPGVGEDSWVTNQCGPSADSINFMRTSISPHAWRSGIDGNCGFHVSEAGGGELGEPQSVRVVGSFHGKVINVDSQVTVTYDLGIDFDLALGTSFP